MLRFRTTLAALAIGLTLALAPIAASVYAHAQEAAQPRPITVQEMAPATVYTPVAVEPPQAVAAPTQNPDGSWNFTPVIDGFVKFAGGVLALVGSWLLAQASWPFKKWLGLDINTKAIAKDLKMDEYANLAAREAIDWARQQTGLTDADLKDVNFRNPFLSMAASYLFRTDNEVWTWVASSEKGVMHWIESKLSADAALPKTVVDGVGIVPAGTAP